MDHNRTGEASGHVNSAQSADNKDMRSDNPNYGIPVRNAQTARHVEHHEGANRRVETELRHNNEFDVELRELRAIVLEMRGTLNTMNERHLRDMIGIRNTLE